MELTADYFNRHSNEKAHYSSDGTSLADVKEKNNLNLWKFNADFTYPYNRNLTWQFGASAQFLNSRYTPTVYSDNDRFETSESPSKSTGFTPIVYVSAKGMLWKLRYSLGFNWQLNRIEYSDLNNNEKTHNTQWAINPMV